MSSVSALSFQSFEINEEELAKHSPAEQERFRDRLAALNTQLQTNPLIAYAPHDKQKLFHESKDRTRAFIAGNRAGKSTAGVADDLVQALPQELVPPHLLPYKRFGHDRPFRGRVITPDLGHTMEVVLQKFREMTPRGALSGNQWEKAYDKTKRILRFNNGALIDFMSTEQDPDKFGGVALHRVHYDEEPSGPNSQTIYQESQVRLIDYGGDTLLTMTPLFGLSWVYDEIWERRHQPDLTVIRASMRDNPVLPPEEIDRATARWTEEERRAREHGEFVHFEGSFYPEFTDATHVVKVPSPEDLKTLDVVVGIDPGLERTGVLWVAFDNDNGALAFAELYPRDALVPHVADQIRYVNQRCGVDPIFYVIDPSARIRATINQEQIQAEYGREGIPTIWGQNARGPGILEVKRRLQHGMLKVSKECRNLIWEFGRYRKDPNANDEFAAIKRDDHLLDALRYVCMSRPWTYISLPDVREEPWRPGWAPPGEWLDQYQPTSSPPLGDMT